MPGDGLTHGPPATKNAGGSHHRFSRINRRIQTVVATPRFGGCDEGSKEAINPGAAAIAGTAVCCGAR